MGYKDLSDAAKIVILSTLNKPRSLSEISKKWYGNRSRFYLDRYVKQINEAVKNGLLIREDEKYKAKFESILKEVANSIKIRFNNKQSKQHSEKYIQKIDYFYTNLKEFTVECYLDLEVIMAVVNNNPQKALDQELEFYFILPFLMRYIEWKDKSIFHLFLKEWNLEYYNKLTILLERKNVHILEKRKRIKEWVEVFRDIIKSYYPQFVKESPDFLRNNFDSFLSLGGARNEKF
ncbi:hypothetical protein HYW20_08055 [Candidatus Woesearchaeota archaeon]|nr:hypothetical protein [Candidatus Woesearchaeota archaeon]